jgi:hypothetical protein
MHPKTKELVDMLDSTNISQTQAYLKLHPTASRETASANASKILRSTNVVIYRKKAARLARHTIVEIMKDKNVKPDTRIKAAQDILDRNLGKAVQRSETQSTNLNLNIEASKELADDFTAFIKNKTQQS